VTATLLKPGALEGCAVAAGGACAAACAGAGATIVAPGEARIDTLVVDAGVLFGDGGLTGLRAALDGAWSAVLEVAREHWLGADADAGADAGAGTGGKLVLLAPRGDAGEHARAAAAGLESLARTLAVEWARHGVRATVVVAGPRTTDDELGALVAFLASAGGEYFSGCRFDLR
jgi:NAD(P)-dependent dehydrogenase (short-subunit alcohol dehydrogenase family)